MATNDQTEVFGRPEGTWVWCLHCERCYQVGEYRAVKPDRQMRNAGFTEDLQMCPYPDCDGDTVFDAFPWEGIRGLHPDYPEIPERGKVYPQY